MYVTFEDYIALGYSAADKSAFDRLSIRAEQIVRKHTFNRIEDDTITEIGKRGVCEIIDLEYIKPKNMTVSNDEGEVLTGFSNGSYSESFASGSQVADAINAIDASVIDIINTYFTADELWRGY